MVITIDNLPANATFVDSGNGVALFDFNPTVSQIDSIFSVNYIVQDSTGAADTISTSYRVIAFFRGDANSDGELSMLDIMYLVNFLYKDGPPPASDDVADANNDSIVNIMDPTYLVSFFYKQGPPPPGE